MLRVAAAIFSEGYAFHDDHFDVTRVAHSWAHGIPHWLQSGLPPKHSMFYAGLNAGIIWVTELFGAQDSYTITLVMRVVHALYSSLIVLFCFKISFHLSDLSSAKLTGWIVALLWFMPFMGVKFLVEMVCIPPILIGFYLLLNVQNSSASKILSYLMAGALFGLAFAFRYHTILFAGGLGLVLLFRKQWKGSVLFTFGYIAAAFLTVGLIDIIFFDYPFHSIVEYFDYNRNNSGNYISGSPLKFTLTTFGFLIPPVSIFLMIGFVRSFKIEPMMFTAVLVFFLFHSAFPNQQERFILPMFPMLIILGVIGWRELSSNWAFWNKYPIIKTISWRFFWIINIIGALFLAGTFSKRDRIEPLHYLSDKQDLKALIIENEKSVKQPPVFYLGENSSDFNEWDKKLLGLDSIDFLQPDHRVVYTIYPGKSVLQLKNEIAEAQKAPNYIIFQGMTDLEKRKNRLSKIYNGHELLLLETVRPSLLDRILHYINPRHHRDQTATIYKIE